MKEEKGILYLIPTPIGNMDDITKRIVETLRSVDVLFCEDTRSTNILLNYLGIKKKLISNHKFNEVKNKNKILNFLQMGLKVGIVSDRGTPVISDPGYILTKDVIENGYTVIALPGPTAFVPALISSGIIPQPFIFYGFLSSKKSIRIKELEKLKYEKYTLIFYEAPHRIETTIKDLGNIFGDDRKVSISREITKKYEKTYYGNLENIMNFLDEIKGEFVIVVEGNKEIDNLDDIDLIEHIKYYIEKGMPSMEAIKQVSKERNMKKSEVYKLYQEEKEK